MPKPWNQQGEQALLKQLQPHLPPTPSVLVGPGDDCAVVSPPPAQSQTLLKTDAIVEGVHFLPDEKPERIGRKALARALSDFAAMGGEPQHALITLALTKGRPFCEVEGLYRGLAALAKRWQVAIAGGETVALPENAQPSLMISVAMSGWVKKDQACLRSGAKLGDVFLVTGELGGSLAGKHLDFEPRLQEGKWLAQRPEVHAMMDLSDGLAADLPKLCHASEVDVEFWKEKVPCTPSCDLQAAMEDGEDYELLLAVAGEEVEGLLGKWKKEFPALPLSAIGRCVDVGQGLLARDQWPWKGYDHAS